MNISFAGCGFLGIYHIGVASCFREHAPHIIDKISGASAGALLGTVLVCDELDLGKITEDVLKTAAKARARSLGPFHPGFNLHQILVDGMERILPQDIHKRASGRLHISLTRMSDRKNVMVSEFETRQELMDAILCSAFIPFYSGFLPPTYKGTRYVDGGISDNLPIIDPNCKTITVSPLSGEADICPRSDEFSDYLNVTIANTNVQITPSNLYRMCRAFYPPEPAVLSRMCKQGFEDALLYLKSHTLIPCERHIIKQRSHSVCLGNPRMSPMQSSKKQSVNRRRSASTVQNRSAPTLQSRSPPSMALDVPGTTSSDVRWYLSEEEEEEGSIEEESEDEVDCMVHDHLHDDEAEDDVDGKMWVDWDDNDFFENRPCERCEHHSNKLKLVKSLPPEIIQVLHAACHSLNPSIWNYLTTSRLGSVVSFASLPCVLPVETAYSLAIRLTRYLPHLPSDLRWFVSGLTSTLHLIGSNIGHVDIKKFEAQFSCNFGLQLEPEHLSTMAGCPVSSDPPSDHAHELQALDIATGKTRRRKLNFQFSMDVQAEGLPDCVIDTFDFCDDLNELTIPRRKRVAVNQHTATSTHLDHSPCDNDSFEYTLKIREEMDDVLTYHYLHVTQQRDPGDGHGSVEVVEL